MSLVVCRVSFLSTAGGSQLRTRRFRGDAALGLCSRGHRFGQAFHRRHSSTLEIVVAFSAPSMETILQRCIIVHVVVGILLRRIDADVTNKLQGRRLLIR